jgi:hypothetical protein
MGRALIRLSTALALILVASGCGENTPATGGADSGVDGSSVSGNSDCRSLCERASECFSGLGSVSICASECDRQVSLYGELGEDVIAECLLCAEGASCTELATGACDSACPNAPWVGGGDDGGGDGGGDRCEVEWRQDEVDYEVWCERYDPDAAYFCECFEGGIDVDSFTSSDFCAVARTDQADRAARGCSWDLGTPCTHDWYFDSGYLSELRDTRHFAVTCEPDAAAEQVVYACQCELDDSAAGSFTNTDFCGVSSTQRQAAAESGCGWDLISDCEQTWSVGDTTYSVVCTAEEWDEGYGRDLVTTLSHQCDCRVGDGETGSFSASNFCGLDLSDRTRLANAACSWSLPGGE